jgi:sigma-B regulation protein RsbU (phosphoserine phosphatase)
VTLLRETDGGRSATLLNEFVCPRHDDCTFVTLWLGIFDLTTHELTYVDAGHGYALLRREDGAFEPLDHGDNIPIGVDQAVQYSCATVRLDQGGAVFVVSDGIIEQPTISDAAIERFGLPRLKAVLTGPSDGDDAIAHIFAALERHASGSRFSDDATAVMVHW